MRGGTVEDEGRRDRWEFEREKRRDRQGRWAATEWIAKGVSAGGEERIDIFDDFVVEFLVDLFFFM